YRAVEQAPASPWSPPHWLIDHQDRYQFVGGESTLEVCRRTGQPPPHAWIVGQAGDAILWLLSPGNYDRDAFLDVRNPNFSRRQRIKLKELRASLLDSQTHELLNNSDECFDFLSSVLAAIQPGGAHLGRRTLGRRATRVT